MGTKFGASGQLLVPQNGSFFGSHFGNPQWVLINKINNGTRFGSQNENQIWAHFGYRNVPCWAQKTYPKWGEVGAQTWDPQFALLGPPSEALGQGFGFRSELGAGVRLLLPTPSAPLPPLPSPPSPLPPLPSPPHPFPTRLSRYPSPSFRPRSSAPSPFPFDAVLPFLGLPSPFASPLTKSGMALLVTVRSPLF